MKFLTLVMAISIIASKVALGSMNSSKDLDYNTVRSPSFTKNNPIGFNSEKADSDSSKTKLKYYIKIAFKADVSLASMAFIAGSINLAANHSFVDKPYTDGLFIASLGLGLTGTILYAAKSYAIYKKEILEKNLEF